MAEPTIEDYFDRGPDVPAVGRVPGAGPGRRPVPLRRGRGRLRGLLGPPGPGAGRPGSTTSTRCSSGSCPSPSGSSAARSTCRTTASTATSRPAGATRSPTTGRASRATPAPSPTPSCSTRCAASPTCCKGLGVERGDRVGIYMPMIPELPVAMLACTRIGAAHSVRLRRLLARLHHRPHQRRRGQGPRHRRRRLPAGRGRRRSSPPSTRRSRRRPSIDHVVVVRRTRRRRRRWSTGRDHWYHDLMADASPECPPEHMDSEDLLYLLYTSGTTAKPKGIMHTTGGYLTQVAFTHKYVFDLHPDDDVYWCAADIGWVTGHSYIVYGPLTNGATTVMYEGTPDTPGQGPPVVDRRALRRDPALHRAHRHPHVHEVGRPGARPRTTCRACGCSARWASPSTPRRGCGTTRTSAAGAARSSTPGGRPRPART